MLRDSRVHIGNQTAFSAPPLVPFLFAVEHGFDAFEFFPDGVPPYAGWSATDLPPTTRAFVRGKAAEEGIRLSVHASLTCDLRTASGRNIFERDADFARDIGARVVVVHIDPTDVEAFAEAVLAVVDPLASAGILLSIENTVGSGPDDFNTLFRTLQSLDRARACHVGMCLDIGHANLHPSTRNRYLDYLDRLSSGVPIGHLHVHENWGDRDSHMTLFTGHAGRDPSGVEGLARRLSRRGFEGSWVMEQWPEPSSLLSVARDRCLAILKVSANEERTIAIGP